MATSSASVKLKRLRQRFGISAPRVAVRTHVAWYWRALAMIAILTISLALAEWIYDAGRRIAGFDSNESVREIQSLRNYVMELDSELTKLRSVAGSGESSLQIERATQKQLSRQVKSLESENEALKQDLAFFEGLMPASGLGEEVGVKIDRLRIEADSKSGEYRYRMLVVNNGGRQAKEIKGLLQLLVKVQRGGKDAMITIPSDTDPNPQRFRIEIRHFHRLEGVFSIPDDAVIKGVEVRLLQDGVVRARQTATL
jgi:multidrug efflux pump subunit AcrA (membrane-fusion protein)